MAGKFKRRVKELIGGKKTYRKSELELGLGKIKRSLRRAKSRVKKETGEDTVAVNKRQDNASYSTKRSVPSYGKWLKKTGKGATAATMGQYRRMKKANQ